MPFGVSLFYIKQEYPEVATFKKARNTLDKAVFGHIRPKKNTYCLE